MSGRAEVIITTMLYPVCVMMAGQVGGGPGVSMVKRLGVGARTNRNETGGAKQTGKCDGIQRDGWMGG